MIVIADTGPLIGLAKIHRLMPLERLADAVLIPPMVRRELLGHVGDEASVIDEALEHLLRIEAPGPLSPGTEEAVASLDPGERSVIALAVTWETDAIVLMDDRAGRRVARELDLPVTGLIGVLLRLKEIGEIKAVSPLLEEVRSRGYWPSDEIIATARRLAKEE